MAYEKRETVNLIGSDKVEGTAVYGSDSQRMGSIERVMINKVSGKVAYAVLGFGGFLGIGDDHYALPWQSLKYDTNLGGYVTGITESQLTGAPKYSNESSWNWTDSAVAQSVDDYYRGIPAPNVAEVRLTDKPINGRGFVRFEAVRIFESERARRGSGLCDRARLAVEIRDLREVHAGRGGPLETMFSIEGTTKAAATR
jgi:hypothetical protein